MHRSSLHIVPEPLPSERESYGIALQEWGQSQLSLSNQELRLLLVPKPSLWRRFCQRARLAASEVLGEAAYWTERLTLFFRERGEDTLLWMGIKFVFFTVLMYAAIVALLLLSGGAR